MAEGKIVTGDNKGKNIKEGGYQPTNIITGTPPSGGSGGQKPASGNTSDTTSSSSDSTKK